jgi:phosphatidylethanolamine/phosphatidyl-N-methylethanolamine N-methyltransferase
MTISHPDDYGDFLRGLINDPKGVSAPTPSSPALARAIAAQVDPARDGLVIELGPGTGVVTQALLDRGIPTERLLAIEQEPSFVGLMRERFPSVNVCSGDALMFEHCIPSGARVAAIVSGLPLLNFPISTRRSLLRRALHCQGSGQGSGGRFIQLSYSWRPPVAPDPGINLEGRTVWRNFPPAHVWTYRRG